MPTSDHHGARDRRVLVLSPTGRDAELARASLGDAGVDADPCRSLEELRVELGAGAGALLVAEEALTAGDLDVLRELLEDQPAWSDIALILLVMPVPPGGNRAELLARIAEVGNVTFIERPTTPRTLVSTVTSALRARARQYESRDLMNDLRVALAHARSAQQAVGRSEAKHRALFEHLPDAVFLTVPEGGIAAANPAACAMFGMTEEEIVRGGREVLIDRTDPRHAAFFEERRRAGFVSNRELTFVRKSGERFPGEVTSALLNMPELQAFVVVRDISGRRQTEEALRRREATLAQAGRMAHLGAWDIEVVDTHDLATNRLRWSDEVYRMFGYEPGSVEVTNELFMQHVHRDDRPRVAAAITEAIASRRQYSVEHRVVRTDGTERIVQENAYVEFDRWGVLKRIIGAVQDVTARKRDEEALRASEARFRTIFEQAAIGIGRVRFSDARWIDVNDAFCSMLGHTREHMLATPWPEMTYREDLDADLVPFRRMADGELGSYTVEKRFIHQRGHHVWARLTLSLVRDAQGRPDYEIAIIEDITEMKRAQDALREANEQLRQGDRRKNEFLAVLSHELRNPLAPIRNSVYVLEHAKPGGEQADRARQVIDRQATHMAHLIDDLLDVTRISRGKITLQRDRVDINALARGTIEDHREVFARNGVELVFEDSLEQLWVDGDRTRLAQVIGNLLSNSAKFTPRGGRTVLSVETSGGREAVIRVRDNGMGMSPDTVAHLFEPFVQAAQTLERTRGGLGLGLATVKGLVEMHGGTVTAQSEGEGKGAEFVLRLPLQPAARPRLAVVAGAARHAGARRVLVVEDNVDAAETLKVALELCDHEVAIAHSGPEGIEVAHEFRPDVVLCDLGLPGMDGYGVARTLREDPDDELASAFLVALSGYALQEDVTKSAEAGFDRHMAKPPSIEALESVLRETPQRATGATH